MSAHHTTAFFWNLAWALAALVVAAGYLWLVFANTLAAAIVALLACAALVWAIVRGGSDK
jgi:hypothetical protein